MILLLLLLLFTFSLLADSAALPPHWDAMKDFLQLFPLKANAKEYQEVEAELTKTGLIPSIVSVRSQQQQLNLNV